MARGPTDVLSSPRPGRSVRDRFGRVILAAIVTAIASGCTMHVTFYAKHYHYQGNERPEDDPDETILEVQPE